MVTRSQAAAILDLKLVLTLTLSVSLGTALRPRWLWQPRLAWPATAAWLSLATHTTGLLLSHHTNNWIKTFIPHTNFSFDDVKSPRTSPVTGPSCLSVRSGPSEVDISSSQSPESEECKPAFRDPERVRVRNGDIRDHAKTGS